MCTQPAARSLAGCARDLQPGRCLRGLDTGGLRLHAVIGGGRPPLLLVRSWPDYWYVWRLVMPALARDYEVIVVDQRGIGLTDKPRMGTTPAPSLATWSR
jgi:pimeloyl-ACP methyl ester carboxylesterase